MNKWSRELMGAMREIALIVIGVSIALWADTWLERHKNTTEEFARLHALQDNVERTLANVKSARRDATSAAEALLALATLDPAADKRIEETEQLIRSALLYGSNFEPEMNVYDDLKNTGELAMLTNHPLRRALARMDSRLEIMKFAQADLLTVQQLNIDPYMIENIDLRWLYDVHTDSETGDDETLSYIELGTDDYFRNLILFKLDLVRQLNLEMQAAETALVDVQKLIATQLER